MPTFSSRLTIYLGARGVQGLVTLFCCVRVLPDWQMQSRRLEPFRFSFLDVRGLWEIKLAAKRTLSCTSFRFMGDFVPNLYKTASIKRCESRSSRVDQEVTRTRGPRVPNLTHTLMLSSRIVFMCLL